MRQRYVIVYFLDLPTGVFPADKWPLHVTLVVPFLTQRNEDDILRVLTSLAARTRPVPVIVDGFATFGSRQKVPVALIRSNAVLLDFHRALVDAGDTLGVRYVDTKHQRGGYRPHVTLRHGFSLEPGFPFTIDSFSLVASDWGMRRVVRTFSLG